MSLDTELGALEKLWNIIASWHRNQRNEYHANEDVFHSKLPVSCS